MKKSTLLRTVLIFSLFFFVKNIQAQNVEITTNNNVYCSFDEVLVTISGGQGPYVIDWGDGTSQTFDLEGSYVHFYGFEGTLLVSVTDGNGDEAWVDLILVNCFFDIIGNFDPCVGDCEVYFTGNGGVVDWGVVDANGNIYFQTFGSELEYCWDTPGEFMIVASDATGQFIEQSVVVSLGSAPVNIVSLSNAFCLADSLNPSSCDKICANSTAIYTVPGGQNVTWEVLGADNFTANGNQVEVEWGAPGSGLVTATASTNNDDPLTVVCNSFLMSGFAGVTFAAGVDVTGGVQGYTYTWVGPNGFSSSLQNIGFTPATADLEGIYTVTVTDANGNSAECSVTLASQITIGGGCFVAYDYNSQDASDCNSCDGSATFNISDQNPQAIYQYLWSSGETTSSINGLCPGTYTVTATDASSTDGCFFVQNFVISCDSIPPGNGCPSTTSLCIDILEDPDAKFSTIPAAVNGVVNICEGGTVVFNNESEGASIFEWSFGNGNVSTAVNAQQTYPTAGTYEAYLISRNDCYCSDTTFLTIEVADAISPTLDCVGTVCENTTATYTTSASCGSYDWQITGDYIIQDGGGSGDDFITIEWLTGPEGIIELSVSGCSGGNFCLEPTVEVVPIISDNATIKGPEKVCRLDEASYFIDDYSATDFVWTVSAGGSILDGQNTSSITVRWDGPVSPNAAQWVSVDYENCYLGCGGTDTKDVYILPEYFIEGAIEVCENEMSIHEAKKSVVAGANEVDCNWTVTAGNGTVVYTSPAPTNSISLDWNLISVGAGRYAILAIPANALEVCTDEFTSYLNVVEPPAAPTSIGGTTQICPGETYTYVVNTPNPDYLFNWTINDGGTITTQTGKAINVIFGNTPPYNLSVTQTSTDGLACESDPVSLDVFPIPNFTVTGTDEVCEEAEGVYTADFFDAVIYDWEIIPADAGTIISGQNSNSIEVFWHVDGVADVQVTMCNMTETMPVTVIAKPDPIVTGDLFVCPGETTTIGTSTVFNSYLWKTESGSTITNTATADLPPGAYELVVTNNFGCENNTAFIITGFPQPLVSISIPGSWGRCYQGANPDPPAELQAMEVPAGYTYEWFQDNVAIPNSNTSVITTMDFGNFYVAVTDQNGCETFSKVITLFELCGGGGGVCNNPGLPAGCDQGTDVQMSFTGTGDCSLFNFQNDSPNFLPGTINWNFDDPSSPNNTSVLENPSHEFSRAGHYIVTLTALTPGGALCWDSKLVTVPIAPNFDAGVACAGSPMAFVDLTGNIPGETVSAWSWDFGDPTSGANNTSTDQNPSHVFANEGTYTVTLTASHISGCSSSFSKTISVEESPTVNFDEPVLNCQGTALSFVAVGSADAIFYDWDFGDPASGEANTSEIIDPFHAYESPGNYSVTCTVTDVWGCTSSETKVVVVEPNTLGGDITFSTPSPICDGDVTTLTAPPGGTSWEWSDGTTVTETLTTGEAGAYMVTVTNSIGCQYISPAAVLDVIALPSATIQAVEYDEFGNPINVFYDNYATCEGEDVFLQVVENAGYVFTWSDGTNGSLLEYSEERGNLLSAGTYTITLDIFDTATGCSNTVGPFDLVVHPTPTDILISANPTGPNCENTLTTLSVDNPSVDLTYVWNTGEIGTSIEVLAGGEYFVRGITMFGCSGESNKIEIIPGPDIRKIPDGCHTRCNPDTICLPTINGVVDYQWYLDGTAIPGPGGSVGNLIAVESGDYQVVMTDGNGCQTTSDILTLDLYTGFGTFEGNVYMDVNGNGIIDAPDTLVSGVDIILANNGTALDTVTSGVDGEYSFIDILSTNYNLQLDLTGLPPNVIALWNSLDSNLVGCDDLENIDWLLQVACPTFTSNFDDETCFGEDYFFDGVIVPPGAPMDFDYLDINGCDSIITVTITELPDYNIATMLSACDGNDVIYNGVTITAGAPVEFPMISPEGCEFFETVTLIPNPTSSDIVNLEVCADEMATFDNQDLAPGTQTEFNYVNQFGCDSTILVVVDALPLPQFDLQTDEPCWNINDGVITINNPTGTGPFTYSLDGTNFQSAPLFENLPAMNYTVQMQSGNGCDNEAEVTLAAIPQLQMEIVTPALPCDGGDVVLFPQFLSGDFSNVIFEWSNGSPESQISVNQAETYYLSASNECETITEAAVVGYGNEGRRASYLYIPNVFTPNGDGYNDDFRVYPSPDVVVESFDFYIFDRWGNHLYDTHNIKDGWDGRMNSKFLNPGVYVYYVRAKITTCGETFDTFQKGDVTIMH